MSSAAANELDDVTGVSEGSFKVDSTLDAYGAEDAHALMSVHHTA